MIIKNYAYKDDFKFRQLYNKFKTKSAPKITKKMAMLISDLIYLEDCTLTVSLEGKYPYVIKNCFVDTDIKYHLQDKYIRWQENQPLFATILEILEQAYDLILLQKEDGFLENFTKNVKDIETLRLMVECEKSESASENIPEELKYIRRNDYSAD